MAFSPTQYCNTNLVWGMESNASTKAKTPSAIKHVQLTKISVTRVSIFNLYFAIPYGNVLARVAMPRSRSSGLLSRIRYHPGCHEGWIDEEFYLSSYVIDVGNNGYVANYDIQNFSWYSFLKSAKIGL
jgi:hypothetical protein